MSEVEVVEELAEIRAQLEELNKTMEHLTMIHLAALLFTSALLALLLLR